MTSGDKVICVDAKFGPAIVPLYTVLPKQDSVYVVRDIRLGIQPDCRTGDVSVLLVGLVNPPANSRSALERGFRQDRFKSLDELRATDEDLAALRKAKPELMRKIKEILNA